MKLFKHLLVIVLFWSCSPKLAPTPLQVETKVMHAFALPYSVDSLGMGFWDYFEENGREYLVMLADGKKEAGGKHSLIVFDIKKQTKISQMALEEVWQAKPFVKQVKYVGKDSFLVVFPVADAPYFEEDSTLVLFNSKGKTLKVFSMGDWSVPLKNNPGNPDSVQNMDFSVSPHIPYENQHIYIPLRRPRMGYDSSAIKYEMPPMGMLNMKDNHFRPLVDFHYPKEIRYKPYAQDYTVPRISLSLKGKPLLYWGYDANILEWNAQNNTKQTHIVSPSVLLGKIQDVPLGKDGTPTYFDFYSPDAGGYTYLLADKYRNRYLWFTALPTSYYGTDPYFAAPKTGVMVLDSLFHVQGEGIASQQLFYTHPAITQSGLLVWDLLKNQKNKENHYASDSIYFQILDIHVNEKNKVSPMPTQKISQKIESYLQQKFPNISLKQSVVLISPLNPYCHNCISDLEERIGKKESKNAYPSTYLLYLQEGINDDYVNYISDNQLDKTRVWIDSKGEYKSFFTLNNNPIVYFMKEGKIAKSYTITSRNESFVLEEIQAFVKP